MLQMIMAITAFWAVLLFFPRYGWTDLFPSLPYPGPFEGQVRDRNTDRPIPGAQIFCHWNCADLPIPHAPGEVHIYADAPSDAAGFYRIEKSTRRGGFAGCSFSITCKARGYIEIVLIGDPDGRELPPSTQAWPFAETSVQRIIPNKLDFKMTPSLPVLQQALQSKNDQYRLVAAEALGRIGPEAEAAVPALVLAATDPQTEIRRRAVEALGLIAPTNQSAISALVSALTDPDPTIREHSLKSLVQSGPAASHVVPELMAALQDKDPIVRRRVPAALAAIAPGDHRAVPGIVPALVGALQDMDSRTVQEASYTLSRLGDESLPEMIEFLCHTNPNVRKTITRILISRNQAGKLSELIQTRNPALRLAAVKHMGCLAREKKEFISIIANLLLDEHPEIREEAVTALAGIGDPAQPFLFKMLKTADPGVHAAVARTLFFGQQAGLKTDPQSATDLIQAIQRRSEAEIVSILSLGVDVNAAGERGFRPLMAAAGRRRVEIINLLLACGAKIDTADDSGCTALMHAARTGNEIGARILIDRDANIHLKDMFNHTALVYAARSNTTGLIELLLNHGTDANSQGEALYFAALDGRTEAAEFLLNHGVPLETVNKEGNTPLMAAAIFGKVETAKFLLDRGANVNARNHYGWTALIYSTSSGIIKTVRLLLTRDALVDAKTNHNETALMFAAKEGHQEVVELLLEAGANPRLRNRSGKTARDLALAHGHHKIARMLQ